MLACEGRVLPHLLMHGMHSGPIVVFRALDNHGMEQIPSVDRQTELRRLATDRPAPRARRLAPELFVSEACWLDAVPVQAVVE
jgi:hypothetical protein